MTEHWLRRPGTIRRLWVVFVTVLAATVAADLFFHRHDLFGIDGSFGFYAWYGFVACVGLVLGSRLLGLLLKRADTYYDD
jgi:hypothetical protein